MAFVTKAAIDKLDAAIHSAPNELTQILRGHRAIEVEIHNSLGLRLSLSSRLDLHKIPFLTKVDLLISLEALKAPFFPLFGEVNRIRNRFAHNPDASTTEEDLIRFRNIHSSSLGSEISPSLEIDTPNHGMRYLLLLVYTAARSSYEFGVNERVQTRAINEWILEQNTGKEELYKNEEFRRIRREADETLATAAKALLKTEHPDVDFHNLHGTPGDKETSIKKD